MTDQSVAGKVPAGAKRPQPKGGSRKGKPNKVTRELRELILGALDDAGGQAYLSERARDPRTASAFLTLVGKVLPLAVTGGDGGPIQTLSRIELVPLVSGSGSPAA
ncbi:MAG: hypothetical protein KBF50_12155 [Steroidobacteraceae bacterium]|nr:hypothetical protein [Steroidobacteraceae bacterium]